MYAILPSKTSWTRIGVVSIPRKVRSHTIPPMIGNVDSPAAACIAVEARSPGAMKTR